MIQPNAEHDNPKSLYDQDVEARARRRGTSIEDVRRADEQLLSHPRLSEDCLRPDQIMMCATDSEMLPHRLWAHFESCDYCRAAVALAKPSPERADRMAKLLAEMADHADKIGSPTTAPSRAIRWADAVMVKIDQTFTFAWKFSPALAVLFFAIYIGSPDWLRSNTPTWVWTDRQLRQSATRILLNGDSEEAYELSNAMVKRDPNDLDGLFIRYQALINKGETKRGTDEAAMVMQKLLGQMPQTDRAAVVSKLYSTTFKQDESSSSTRQ